MNQTLKWITTMKKECPTCTGSGTISCKCNDNNEIACPNCGGKGVVTRRATTTQKKEMPCDHPQCQQGKVSCGVCNGTGRTAKGEPCPSCKGKGTVTCPVCGGLGRIQRSTQESWLEHETCHICNGRGMVDCYLCHGTKERVCPTCKGKGTVLDQGKIVLLVALALLLLAVPVLFVAVAGIALGGCLFLLWKEQQSRKEEQAASEQSEPTDEDTI